MAMVIVGFKTNKGVPKELILLDSSITTIEKVNGKLFVLRSADKQFKIALRKHSAY